MDSKIIFAFLIIGFVILSGCTQAGQQTPSNGGGAVTTPPSAITNGGTENGGLEVGTFEIEAINSGYNPSTLTIKKGSTINFVNNSGTKNWPASAVHPTHVAYPTGGGCIGSTFDACRGLNPGETFSFTFDEVGEWGFHNHLNSSNFGKITVVE